MKKSDIENYSGGSDQSIQDPDKVFQKTPSSKIKVIISENKLASGTVPTVFGGIERFYDNQEDIKQRQQLDFLKVSQKFDSIPAAIENLDDMADNIDNATGYNDASCSFSFIDVAGKFEDLNIAGNLNHQNNVNDSKLNLFNLENDNIYDEHTPGFSSSNPYFSGTYVTTSDSNESLEDTRNINTQTRIGDDFLNFNDFVPLDVNTSSYYNSDIFTTTSNKKNVNFTNDPNYRFPDTFDLSRVTNSRMNFDNANRRNDEKLLVTNNNEDESISSNASDKPVSEENS
ncbi:unnamed protein product [Brassicogethes aeneus]|uniref:Uncharacterized protein n=1 Tax=Brassicogethes aeneus TaxID=1431903 RepID=A0A9P0FDF5_BRAAE|nr:unnamed protein product [Brassicogethes aeneus]